jgi:DNA-binding transcriptional MerR regulator
MKIGELSRRTGVSVRALRYYEEQELLRPERRPSGYREYGERDVALVARIQTLISAGLTTTVIAPVLHCFSDGGAGNTPIPTCAEMVGELTEARDRLLGRMKEMEASCTLLSAIIEATPAHSDATGARSAPPP